MAAVLAACVGVIAGLVILAARGLLHAWLHRAVPWEPLPPPAPVRALVFNQDPLSSSTWSEAA